MCSYLAQLIVYHCPHSYCDYNSGKHFTFKSHIMAKHRKVPFHCRQYNYKSKEGVGNVALSHVRSKHSKDESCYWSVVCDVWWCILGPNIQLIMVIEKSWKVPCGITAVQSYFLYSVKYIRKGKTNLQKVNKVSTTNDTDPQINGITAAIFTA